MTSLIKSAASKATELKNKVLGTVTAYMRSFGAPILIVLLGAIIVALPFVTTPWWWLPQTGEAETFLATLLTAQAAIAALTLAVTLFVMQGASVRLDADDRMYREYIRQSWVQRIFWGSILAVGTTGLVFLSQGFISGHEMAEGILPGLGNLTIVAALAFFANLVLSGILFEKALRLAHPERWSTLRRNVNERDVRDSIQAFLVRNRRAGLSLASDEPDASIFLPNPGEGSADEAIRALLDDARRAMAESKQRDFTRSLDSIQELISYAMDEIEREGIHWRVPGGQPEWPPLRELSRNLYSFRRDVIHEGNREYIFRLLRFDYWVISTGARRRCGDLFTAGLEGYRRNYQIAGGIADEELREILLDRVWLNAAGTITGKESEEVFPYALDMVRLQERLLSDAMHIDQPSDFESLHRSFEASLRFLRWDWQGRSWSSFEPPELYRRLEQEYRIVLMGLAGRAISLAEAGRIANPAPYLEVGRAAHGGRDQLAEDISQALLRDNSLRATQWSEWEWEGAKPGEVQRMDPAQYPLMFFVVRLVELSTNATSALNLHGSANRVLGWFETNAERLLPFVSDTHTATKEERRVWAAGALRASVQVDETAEEERIINSSLSPERIALFKSDVYASAFAVTSVEQVFDQAGAFMYLPFGTDIGPKERGYRRLEPKGFFAELPATTPHYYGSPEGDSWGRGLAEDITRQLCEALDGSPEISLPLNTPGELLRAFEMAQGELGGSSDLTAVLAGNWTRLEIALDSEEHEGYVPGWRIPGVDQVAEVGRYHGHTLLRGPRDGELRLYLVEPSSWGCFVRAQCEGDQDLRIDVRTISAARAQELLNANPNYFPSEPDETSKLRKLQSCVGLEMYARIEFRVKNSSRSRRVVQSGPSTALASQ